MNSCPQCNAEVPSDNAFCGKCGYAMRDQGPHHLDRSRIRVHEGPSSEPPAAAKRRPRQKTVLGIPPAATAGDVPKQGPADEGATPPASPHAAVPASPKGARVPQKTMLGLPQLEVHKAQLEAETQATQELSIEDLAFQLPAPPQPQSAVDEESARPASSAPPRSTPDQSAPESVPTPPPPPFQVMEDTPDPGDAEQDRDSLSLPQPLAARRRWVFLVCALLLVLSIGWLLYRFLAGPAASA